MSAAYVSEASRFRQILTTTRVIAVVGLSPNPARPSHEVARYLQRCGYRVIPVNPKLDGASVLGESSWPTLQKAAQALAADGLTIDLVDCFRRSEEIPALVTDAIAIRAKTIWLQLGVEHEEAEQRALDAGLHVVSDRCIKIEHRLLGL